MWWTLLAWTFGAAVAADDPGLWWSTTGVVALQPGGLLSDTSVQYRAPVMRYGGVAFNDTFIGAGGRFSASPAFVEAAARFDFQPIDLLPLKLEVVNTQYWKSPFGMLPYDQSTLSDGSDGPVRNPRYKDGEGFGGQMWSVIATPTLQMKAGPIVGFTSWSFVWLRMQPYRDFSEPWFFDPFRGTVVGREDLLFEHTSAVLYQHLSGEDEALLRVGAIARGRWSSETPDRMLQVGAAGQFKPDTSPVTPTMLLLVAPYVQDVDYVGPVPFMALLATWEGNPRRQ